MSLPTPARHGDFPLVTGAFDTARAVALAADFCRSYDVARGTAYSVIPRLDQALRIASLTGPDPRWQRMARWSGNNDVDGVPETVLLTDERDVLYNRFVAAMPDADWLPPNTVTSVSRWARFSSAMRAAQTLSLGWILPIAGEVLLVPMPSTRYFGADPRLLHCDTGRPAIEWPDGSGPYYLHGARFDEDLYRAVLGGELSLPAIAALRSAEQRSIALQYLTFQHAEDAGAGLLRDAPVDGLYRVPLPTRLARDRRGGPRAFAYFRRLGDSPSIQWVDPRTAYGDPRELWRAEMQELSMRNL